jgi:hypothetical protein
LAGDFIDLIGIKYSQNVVELAQNIMLFLRSFLQGPGLLRQYFDDNLIMAENILALANYLHSSVISIDKVTPVIKEIARFLLVEKKYQFVVSRYDQDLRKTIENNLSTIEEK